MSEELVEKLRNLMSRSPFVHRDPICAFCLNYDYLMGHHKPGCPWAAVKEALAEHDAEAYLVGQQDD